MNIDPAINVSPVEPAPAGPALPVLSPEEARVLGVLVEKALTTPEYYPLSLNAVVMACNQKNNRQPVTAYDESMVVRAIDDLRDKRLVAMVTESGARVPKYKQLAGEQLGLDPKDIALVAELLLRGPQTPGELRNRADRMTEFADLASVQTALDGLATRALPMVVRLPRQPGMKECRYAHLLGGPIQVTEGEVAPPVEPARGAVQADRDRLAALEQEVIRLKAEWQAVRDEWANFRRQFE